MLFRLVRPVKRLGSSSSYFVQRIPADVRARAVGQTLHIPRGKDAPARVAITATMEAVRVSLLTADPGETKLRQAAAAAYTETVWRALRAERPVSLDHRQATALAGELYRAWANGAARERTLTVIQTGPGKMELVPNETSAEEEEAAFAATLRHLDDLHASGEADDHEPTLGPLVDRLLLGKGIAAVDAPSRRLLLQAFWLALKDAMEVRRRNAGGDYSPDPKAQRFPEWTAPGQSAATLALPAKVSLKELVEDWWREAQAIGRKPSTHESYANTVAAFVAYLKHDDATRVTPEDVIGFKDHRLTFINPRTGKPASAKTIADSDLAGLKSVFGWAVVNRKLPSNPAEGVSLKIGKKQRLRGKGFTDAEAAAILQAALKFRRGGETAATYAAKRWVPWLCAYTGARVGEVAQLRKQDVRREGSHWIIRITPEAGTVKTDEAREVVLHLHLIELGFGEFINAAPPGHLFLKVGREGDVRGPLRGLKNRLAAFSRSIVKDRGVMPNHGWRHRFMTVGREVGIDARVLDAIQGHRPRSVGESYGEVTTKAIAKAIALLPRYDV